MSLDAFIEAVQSIVSKWQGGEDKPNTVHRAMLEAIYAEVRNSTAFELATAQRQLDEALRRLHRKTVLEGELVPRPYENLND
jgi:hypothetical protein